MSVYIRYRDDLLKKIEAQASQQGPREFNRARAPSGQQLQALQQRLREVAGMSTVGIKTLSGVSPKTVALEHSARAIGALATDEEQLAALNIVLEESSTLWSDQNAHVITAIIKDLVVHKRIEPRETACLDTGRMLLQAAMRLGPKLTSTSVVNDAPVLEALNQAVMLLVQQQDFCFDPDIFDRLEQAGFCGAAMKAPEAAQREQAARELRLQILGMTEYDADGRELSDVVTRTAALPDHLRGRILTLLVNMLSNTLWMRASSEIINDVGEMIRNLPISCRITPLEAFHNQIYLLPHESAKLCHPLITEAVWELPDFYDEVFDRSRRDLMAGLQRQGEAFSNGLFRPDETLASFCKRGGMIAHQ